METVELTCPSCKTFLEESFGDFNVYCTRKRCQKCKSSVFVIRTRTDTVVIISNRTLAEVAKQYLPARAV